MGQAAERSGVAPSALQVCERQGLIGSDRTAGDQRRYHGDVMCRVYGAGAPVVTVCGGAA